MPRAWSSLTYPTDDVSLRVRLIVQSNDEIGRLAAAFNHMAEDVEQHQRAAVEQERIRRELELGRLIQTEMLPHAPLHLGLTEVKGVSMPAREVGGDFFNDFELASGRVALLVGDVSGKGVGAALLMANIQASLRTRFALGQEPSAIAEAIVRDIEAVVEMENEVGDMFGTERLESLVTASARDKADAVLIKVEQTISSFRGRRDLFDDATMMAVTVG